MFQWLASLWPRFLASPHKPEWLQALAALATLGVSLVVAYITRRYVRLTARQVNANVLTPLLLEYGSPDMGDAIRRVKAWQQHYGESFHGTAFENALRTVQVGGERRPEFDHEQAVAIDQGPRRLLSQYFARVRALCEHELIDRKLAARALGPEPIALYLEIVDPLDQGQRRALNRPPTRQTREFFERLRALAPEE